MDDREPHPSQAEPTTETTTTTTSQIEVNETGEMSVKIRDLLVQMRVRGPRQIAETTTTSTTTTHRDLEPTTYPGDDLST